MKNIIKIFKTIKSSKHIPILYSRTIKIQMFKIKFKNYVFKVPKIFRYSFINNSFHQINMRKNNHLFYVPSDLFHKNKSSCHFDQNKKHIFSHRASDMTLTSNINSISTIIPLNIIQNLTY